MHDIEVSKQVKRPVQAPSERPTPSASLRARSATAIQSGKDISPRAEIFRGSHAAGLREAEARGLAGP